LRAGFGWNQHIFNESEMALFFECMLLCAQKVLDTADIVREAIYRQLRFLSLLLSSDVVHICCLAVTKAAGTSLMSRCASITTCRLGGSDYFLLADHTTNMAA
jgi:hypothetical protein